MSQEFTRESSPQESQVNRGKIIDSIDKISTAEEEDMKKEDDGMSFWECFSALTKGVLGIGVFFFGSNLQRCGWVLGLALFGICSFMAIFTLHLLNEVARVLNYKNVTFFSVCELIAPSLAKAFEVMVSLICFGGALSYGITWRNGVLFLFKKSFEDNSVTDSLLWRAVAICGVALVFTPFVIRRNLSSLSFFNYFGLCCLLYAIVLGFVYGPEKGTEVSHRIAPKSFLDLFATLPNFFFAFCAHEATFPVCCSLKNPSPQKLNRLVLLSGICGAVLCLPAMIVPYLRFGNALEDAFYWYFPFNGVQKSAVFLVGLAQMFSIPIMLHPGKESLFNVFTIGYERSESFKSKLNVFLTISLVCLLCLLATFISDVGLVIDYSGITAGNLVSFILPSFIYCKVFGGKFDFESRGIKSLTQQPVWKWYAALIVGTACLVVIPFCLTGMIKTG